MSQFPPLSPFHLCLSPFPLSLHFLILFSFPHSLSTSSQPGSQAATGCDSLVWTQKVLQTGHTDLRTRSSSSLLDV